MQQLRFILRNGFTLHVELAIAKNKTQLLHLVGLISLLVKQISDNEIYLLIKYIKSVSWRVAKRVSYIQDARCLKVKATCFGRPAAETCCLNVN